MKLNTKELRTLELGKQESEERFRSVFEAANDAMALSDEQGIVLDANPAYFELYGYSAEEVVGQSFFIIFPEERRPEALEQYRQIFDGALNTLEYETEIRRKDGTTREVEARVGFLTRDGQRTAMLSVIRDITERKQTEARLQRYAEDLKRSNAELEQFAAVASHDLKEPLRMIISYMQLLELRYSELFDADAHEFIGFAIDGAARMKLLIDDFLAYSRMKTDEGDFAPFSSEAALKTALENLRMRIADSGTTVSYDPLPMINGSENMFVYLFQNLFSNAIKFQGATPPEIHVGAERQQDEWLFTVRDNGIGIAPEHLERIFIMFQRLHRNGNYPGTGIGLAICKKVVEYHRGRIWAESKPGEGTTFYFTIPALAADVKAPGE